MASIVSELTKDREECLQRLFSEPVRLHLLYKGSHHGFVLSTLMTKFDHVGGFVVLVFLEDNTIRGGYLSKPPVENSHEDKGAFLFEAKSHTIKFPVRDPSTAVTYDGDQLSFGKCLVFNTYWFTKEEVNFSSGTTYRKTGWEDGEKRFVEVEVHRVQSGGILDLKPWREMTWHWREKEAKNLVSFKPACQSLDRFRVLLLGPAGSGKSSIINSVRSVMYGRVSHMPIFGSGVSKKLKSYDIRSERGGKPTALTLCDVMALGESEGTGLTLTDALAVIKGHVPEGYKFQRDAPINAQTAGYIPEPSINDRIHCVVFILNACKVLTYGDDLQKTVRKVQAEISDLDIPQLVLLTHVDEVCFTIHKDVSKVYTSRLLLDKMQKAAKMMDLPLSFVFPIKNYSSEISVDSKVDMLLLTAMQHILQTADDALEDYAPPAPPNVVV